MMHQNNGIVPADVDSEALKHKLAEQVQQVLARKNGYGASGKNIKRLVFPIGDVEPFEWVQAQTLSTKLYWAGREEDVVVVAVGVADACRSDGSVSFEALQAHLNPILASCDDNVRYYGGMRFDQSKPFDASWKSFGAFGFALPRFEIRVEEGRAGFICNLVLPQDYGELDEILEQIDQLRFPEESLDLHMPGPLDRADLPDENGWSENVRWALSSFEETSLDKVVFARQATFDLSGELDPLVLLKNLKDAKPHCFHFYFQPEPGVAFVGATPERLFRQKGRVVDSEAVAGTRPRGETEEEDRLLLHEMMHNEKDVREHNYVQVNIKEQLEPLSDEVWVDRAPTGMRLASRWHLLSRIKATLRTGVTSLDVLQALHPTPAVGGYPTLEALDAIRLRESFDRGWYAGPVGWIGPDKAEFAVAIRSGLVQGQHLLLYSGAGIVAGSTPEAEWAEIEQKICDFTKVLGLDLERTK